MTSEEKERRLSALAGKARMLGANPAHIGQSTGPLLQLVRKYFRAEFHIAEIGSFSGGSTELFALTCDRVYSIDPYCDGPNPAQDGGVEALREAEAVFVAKMRDYPNVVKIRKRSIDAALDFADASLDAVYIDGNHSPEGLTQDVGAWVPKVRPGGIIAGHDYYDKIALALGVAIGVPHEVFEDSSFVFVKGKANPESFLVKTVDDFAEPSRRLGLFAIVFQVLGVLAAKEAAEHVVVDLIGKTPYLDPSRPEPNPWDYFFAQPGPYNGTHVLADIAAGKIVNYRRGTFTDRNALFSFHAGTLDWPPEILASARAMCARYLKIHPWIIAKADTFYASYMAGKSICALHVRGTDLWTYGHAAGQKLDIWKVFAKLDGKLTTHAFCYLATDEAAVLEKFKARYGARLIHYDEAALSPDERGLHVIPEIPGYKKGEDVIIETLLLSKCDYLLAMSSNVSRFASVYNAKLPYEYIDKDITYRS